MSEEKLKLPKENYLTLIEEENINKNELPNEIKSKIQNFKMQIGRFKASGSEKLKNNLIKMDVEICDMIQNWLEEEIEIEEEKKEETEPKKSEESNKGKEEEKNNQIPEQIKNGEEIDIELDNLLKENKNIVSLQELKNKAPNTYTIIWEYYKEGEDNGIRTSNFSIVELEKEQFTISKN